MFELFPVLFGSEHLPLFFFLAENYCFRTMNFNSSLVCNVLLLGTDGNIQGVEVRLRRFDPLEVEIASAFSKTIFDVF